MEDIKYFAVLYLHWYHKDHHGAVEGVYATKAAAINHINLRKKQSKFVHVNHDKTLLAVNDVKPTNYSQLQYDIFIVLPIHVKKESGKVTLKINVLFPTEVSCAEGENEKYDYAEKLHDRIKQHINIVVLDKHTDKTKLTFSTEDNNLKVVDFVCDCLVKQ